MSRPAADEVQLPEDVVQQLASGAPFPARAPLLALDAGAEGLPAGLRLLLRRELPPTPWQRWRPLVIGASVGAAVGAGMDVARSDDAVPLWAALGLGALAGGSAATLWGARSRRREPEARDHPVDLALGRACTLSERALGQHAFVLWHAGRYWINVALPGRVVTNWSLRADQGADRLDAILDELQAGASMLGALPGAAGGADAARERLGGELERWRALRPELARLRRALRHAAESIADEAHRRRRPHPEGGTEIVWELDLQPLLSEVLRYAGVVEF